MTSENICSAQKISLVPSVEEILDDIEIHSYLDERERESERSEWERLGLWRDPL